MKAVRFHAHGDPGVLRYEDAPDPECRAGQVLVRVRACALNHLDLWQRRGLERVTIPFPHISGADVSGEIAAVGDGLVGLETGTRVMLQPGLSCGRCEACLEGDDNRCRQYDVLGYQSDGGYAEFVAVPAANVMPLPDEIDFVPAAAFPLTFLTAWHMLLARAGVTERDTVLVLAAGSGVGQAAVQIKATDGRGVDVVVEHVGEATWERSVRCLARGGRIVTCGATTGHHARLDLRSLFARQLSLLGSYMGTKADLARAADLFFRGALSPVVDRTFPLSEAGQAHRRLEHADHFGKIVLEV
jgi:NADPH:quinone reductase-like Zn-dependent oxidoreductase